MSFDNKCRLITNVAIPKKLVGGEQKRADESTNADRPLRRQQHRREWE